MTTRMSLGDRLASRYVVAGNGCWLWTGRTTPGGYGSLRNEVGRSEVAHRASYRCHVGSIPAGLQLDHLCRTPRCINPAHLEPVTARENIRRGQAATRTRCLYGHEFTPENTTVDARGWRSCRECRKGPMAAVNGRRSAVRSAERLAATCIECGRPQGNPKRIGKYCSDACGQRHRRRAR